MIVCTFTARESAKPLYDAQMCGSFLFLKVYGCKKNPFIKPHELVQLLNFLLVIFLIHAWDFCQSAFCFWQSR